MSADLLCSCEAIGCVLGRQHVLRGCSLHVLRGELVGLEGENGAGKSTLLECMLGRRRNRTGRVQIHGRLGYCPQGEALHAAYTLGEHLELARSIYARRDRVEPSFVAWLVRRLQLAGHLGQRIDRLSGGMRRKATFLTSVMHQPSLLLLDEPYDGFDWESYRVFWEILEALRHSGTGVLLVTHRMPDRERCDRLYALREGRLHVAA